MYIGRTVGLVWSELGLLYNTLVLTTDTDTATHCFDQIPGQVSDPSLEPTNDGEKELQIVNFMRSF